MSDYTGADIFNEFKYEREDRLESKYKQEVKTNDN